MLKGKAKADYQRDYMREWQRKRRGSKQGLNNEPASGSKQGLNIPGLVMEGNAIIGVSPPALVTVTLDSPKRRMGLIEDRRGNQHEVELDADGNPMPD